MATSVRGKNLEITAALKDYVLKHEKKIMKYFDTDVALQAMLSVEKERKIAELTLRVDGVVLRVVETGEDMYAAIDIVFDKTKLARRIKDGSFKPTLVTESPESDEAFEIVRTKTFTPQPMDVEEAILQMNLVGHDFFVFLNADTDKISVVYKRKHGKYGLIEPEA